MNSEYEKFCEKWKKIWSGENDFEEPLYKQLFKLQCDYNFLVYRLQCTLSKKPKRMKLRIDTINSIIEIEGLVNIQELFDTLQRLFPKDEWRNFNIKGVDHMVFSNPIIYPVYPPVYPTYPQPWITYSVGTSDQDYRISNGVYDVDVRQLCEVSNG